MTKKIIKLTSLLSPQKKVSPAQYLAELMCVRRAKNLGFELTANPWKHFPEWALFYKQQIFVAHALLRKFSIHAILGGLQKYPHAYSLRADFLRQAIIEFREPNPHAPELHKTQNERGHLIPNKSKIMEQL